MLAEEGDDDFAEGCAAGHPLVVVAAAVVVGAVELAPGDRFKEPVEEPFVAGVHTDGDLGLAAIAAEVAFAGEDADEVARREVVHAALQPFAVSVAGPRGCFTVAFPVEQGPEKRGCFTSNMTVKQRSGT